MSRRTDLSSLLSEHGFDTLFAGIPEPAFAFASDGKLIKANQRLIDTLGYSRKELEHMPFGVSSSESDAAAVDAEFAAVVRGEARQFASTRVRKDGSTYRADTTLLPFIYGGETLAVVGFSSEIVNSQHFHQAQQRGEALRRTVGHMARFGAWSVEVPSDEIYWSDEMFEILAFPLGKAPSLEMVLELYPEPDRTQISDALGLCATDGTPFDRLLSIHDITGKLLDVRIMAEAVRDAAGRIIRVHGALYDVSLRSSVEAEQRRVEERLASTMKTISDGIIIFDKDWVFTFVNPRAEVILKKGAAKLAGLTMCAAFPDILGTEFAIDCRRALAEKKTIVTRGYYEPLDLWLDATSYPLDDGLAIYFRDVSEEETARQSIADGAKKLSDQAKLLDLARDAIFVRKMDHTIAYCNRAAEEMYGWSAEEIIGTSVRHLMYTDTTATDAATAATIRDGHWRGELEQLTSSGAKIIADCSWTLVRGDDGEPESILGVNADITERKKLEENNLRTQRMESLGTLAGGVAHDLNNVLTPILMSVQLIASTETDPGRNEMLATMEASVKRGAEMIRQVLSFARGVEGRRIEIDLNNLLSDLFAFCKDSLPKNIVVTRKVGADLWHTTGDPTQLLQVLTNLMNNAKDVLPRGGEIVVRARNVVVEDMLASLSHNVAGPGSYITIDVEDNGSGMSPEVLDRIFEPFFTTKRVGEGTGLGLPTSVAIIRSHGGQLHAYSEPGKGSRFQIHLPATLVSPELESLPDIPEILEEMPRGNGELVLVADDEVAIRQVTCQTLEAYGYATAVASNGAETIGFVEAGADPVDLILTDMMMPIMDGATAAARLHRTHPAIPIIAMSGLIANSAASTSPDSGVQDFLPKPFTTGQLLRAVRGAIQSKSEAHAE